MLTIKKGKVLSHQPIKMRINIPTSWNDKLNSIMEQWNKLSDKEQSELLQVLQQDKKEKLEEDVRGWSRISENRTDNAWETFEYPEITWDPELVEELKGYREQWKEKIQIISKSKSKILKTVKNISVNLKKDTDWKGRLIEFKLWNKKYVILDPKLNIHSDDECNFVKFSGMLWDNIENWTNQKLKQYVKEKQWEWLHIAKIEEMKSILRELWKYAGLGNENEDDEADQIAMLMYLTGMNWGYWLSMWNNKKSWSKDSRSMLYWSVYGRNFYWRDNDCFPESLCMIQISW